MVKRACPAALAVCAASLAAAPAPADVGRATFTDPRDPPAVRSLDARTRARFELGQRVYNTTWVAAGTPRAERRDGLGPLFNAGSCDGCHNNGARGRAAGRGGIAPDSFVMQLGGPPSDYGHVLNTAALPGFAREGRVEITPVEHPGRYPDGATYSLREPSYRVAELAYGALDPAIILRPRIGPALFGAGLIDAVPAPALDSVRRSQPRAQRGERGAGRFGWMADAVSLQDQTERALEREMGLTTAARPQDDCTPAQSACRAASSGGSPEVAAEFLAAILTFERELAVPGATPMRDSPGGKLFARLGCGVCHRDALPSRTEEGEVTIAPYTDLLLHDLGKGLADRRVDGRIVTSRWRTAPLWGLGHELARGEPALLHDGRARSVEEAVLWHDGQARDARRAFEALPAARRAALLDWVSKL